MVFLQPFLLWGAAAIALPVMIHMLSRHRVRELDWAAMHLLRVAAVSRSRRIRLEDVLLLLLRCAAIVLLALALARPVLSLAGPAPQAAAGGGAQGTVIALDGSYSMDYHAGVGSRFERGVRAAREILKNVAAGSRLTVFLMGRRPHVLYKSLNCNPSEAAALLGKSATLPEGLLLEPNLDATAGALREMDVAGRECYLITDVQRTDWGSLPREAREKLNTLAGLGRVFLLPVGDAGRENLAVVNLRPLSGHLVKGEMVRVAAEVRNTGVEVQGNVKVELLLDGAAIDEKRATVGAGQTAPVFLYTRLKASGSHQLAARIAEDGLSLDNTRYAALQVRDALKVLCVDGGLGLNGEVGDSRFLAAALAPSRMKTGSALTVECISKAQFANVRLFDYQIVVLVNIGELPQAQLQPLADFVGWGNGLIVFAGENIIPKVANESFGKAGLLPGELLQPVGDARKEDMAVSAEATDTGGEFAQNLRALPKELLAEPLFFRRFQMKLAPNACEILRFDNGGGTLLAERTVGRGKVLFLNCTADDQWTNLCKTMFFPVLAHQAVTELTQQDSARGFTVGEPLTVALPAEMPGAQIVLADPKGEATTLKVFSVDGRRSISYPRVEWPGIYTLRSPQSATERAETSKSGAAQAAGPAALCLAANLDPRESDVACLQGAELETALKDLPVRIVGGSAAALPQELQQSRTGLPLWRPLLLAALAMFLLEFALAHRYSRASSAKEGAGR